MGLCERVALWGGVTSDALMVGWRGCAPSDTLTSDAPGAGKAAVQGRVVSPPVKAHRSFDPRRVGSLECDAWVAYYRREWWRFLRAVLLLTRLTFALPWASAIHGAWLVLRANQKWAPLPDNDPNGARRAIEHLYQLVARHHRETFDAGRAAQLEVEWWRVHREHQHNGAGSEADPLVDALAALYGYVYAVREADVRTAAEQRAVAMAYSDRWVSEGCDPSSPLIAEERAALVRSYAGLLAAIHRF